MNVIVHPAVLRYHRYTLMCIPKHNRIVFISQYEMALLPSILSKDLKKGTPGTSSARKMKYDIFDKEKDTKNEYDIFLVQSKNLKSLMGWVWFVHSIY